MDTRVMEAATVDTRQERGSRFVTFRARTARVIVLSSAELVDCTCPELCDRDHDRD